MTHIRETETIRITRTAAIVVEDDVKTEFITVVVMTMTEFLNEFRTSLSFVKVS